MKRKREEEQKRKAEERGKRAEQKAKEEAQREEEKARRVKEKARSKGTHDSDRCTRTKMQPRRKIPRVDVNSFEGCDIFSCLSVSNPSTMFQIHTEFFFLSWAQKGPRAQICPVDYLATNPITQSSLWYSVLTSIPRNALPHLIGLDNCIAVQQCLVRNGQSQ